MVPAQIHYDFYAGFKRGIGSTFGYDQEVTVELIDVSIKAFPCQYLPTKRAPEPNVPPEERSSSSSDESDFDKDDPRVHYLTTLACMSVDRLNKVLEQQKRDIMQTFREWVYDFIDINQRHTSYYIFEELA